MPEVRNLQIWGDEVYRLVRGDRIEIPLNGRSKTSIRTTLRSALLHRGYRLSSRTRNGTILLQAAPLNGSTPGPKKDPTLGPGATNVAFVVTLAESERLKWEAAERNVTQSAYLREILRAYWART